MGWLAVAVEQRHRGAPDAAPDELPGTLAHRLEVQLADPPTVGIEPLVDLDHRGIQGLGLDDPQGEKIGPLLGPDAQQVGETTGDEKRRGGAPPLEQGVGAAGGGQPHPHRRQRLVEPPAGHQAAGQKGRLLRRDQLEGVAAGRRHRQRAGELELPRRGVAAGHLHRPIVRADQPKAVTAQEVRRQARDQGRGQAAPAGPLHTPPQPAAAEHLGPVQATAGVTRQTIGERAAGVDPELPDPRHTRATPWGGRARGDRHPRRSDRAGGGARPPAPQPSGGEDQQHQDRQHRQRRQADRHHRQQGRAADLCRRHQGVAEPGGGQ